MDNQQQDKDDWFNRHRMITIGLFLLIVWGSLLIFFFMKAEEVTKNPCNICAKKIGSDVTCFKNNINGENRVIFTQNNSIIYPLERTEIKTLNINTTIR